MKGKVNKNTAKDMYDAVIIGGGPAGLTAAIYLARARYRVVVVEKERFGGQITITEEVVNYPGVKKTSGAELTETMRAQAQSFGAEFIKAEAVGLDMQGDVKTVHTDRGDLQCFGVLLAAGARPRTIGFKGEEQFRGRGVAYCATCDGEFFTGKEIFVIGGGFASAEESVFLTKYARHVTILIREDGFTCAQATAERALNHEKITVLTNVEVDEVSGEDGPDYLRWHNNRTGEVTEYRAPAGESFGVFVFAGYEPATDLVRNLAECDRYGYVVTDRTQKTTCDGLYAAGDVCIKPLRQVVTAVGDGALAATELEKYISEKHKATGIYPVQPAPAGQPEKDESGRDGELFSADMLAQLDAVFGRMQSPLKLVMYGDGTSLSDELKHLLEELCALTGKLTLEISAESAGHTPFVRVCRADGSDTGLAFHGVPGGHEFTSFVLGLYNAAGPGQSLDEGLLARVRAVNGPLDLKVLVSLSCTMCPELVTAAQRLAAENESVSAQVYDINNFPDLRERYNVMSVPCLVVNDGQRVSFGKKNLAQLLDYLEKN